jgi:hypothetical protein
MCELMIRAKGRFLGMNSCNIKVDDIKIIHFQTGDIGLFWMSAEERELTSFHDRTLLSLPRNP